MPSSIGSTGVGEATVKCRAQWRTQWYSQLNCSGYGIPRNVSFTSNGLSDNRVSKSNISRQTDRGLNLTENKSVGVASIRGAWLIFEFEFNGKQFRPRGVAIFEFNGNDLGQGCELFPTPTPTPYPYPYLVPGRPGRTGRTWANSPRAVRHGLIVHDRVH